MKRDQLSKYNAVALNVSCSKLDVRYSREAPFFTMGELEYLIRSLVDSKNTERVKEALHENQFEKMLGNYFLEQFTKANLFRKVSYSTNDDNHKALVAEGYDSIIKLNIEELRLQRAGYADLLNLRVSVVAKMVDLQNEKVIWSQYEVVISDDEHTLDEYRAEGAKVLKESVDKSLRKIGSRLAWDIMYSK